MVNTYHDADSSKDYNPYYKMISREETQTWYDNDKIIDKTLFGSSIDIECNSITW